MKSKLKIWDQQMLLLMDYLISQKKCKSKREFLAGIGMTNTNIYSVRDGLRSFTHEQVYKACKTYNIDMNWIYGLSNSMHLINTSIPPLERIKAAVAELESTTKTPKSMVKKVVNT